MPPCLFVNIIPYEMVNIYKYLINLIMAYTLACFVHRIYYEGENMKPSRNIILYLVLMAMIIIGILLIFLIDWAMLGSETMYFANDLKIS